MFISNIAINISIPLDLIAVLSRKKMNIDVSTSVLNLLLDLLNTGM